MIRRDDIKAGWNQPIGRGFVVLAKLTLEASEQMLDVERVNSHDWSGRLRESQEHCRAEIWQMLYGDIAREIRRIRYMSATDLQSIGKALRELQERLEFVDGESPDKQK